MQVDFSPITAEMMDWRDFDALHPTDIVAEWETPNDRGYSEHWVTRIVFEDSPEWAVVDHSEEPIIEFYDINRFGQFVSAYYASTTLEGWGRGLDLHGDVHSWTMEASDLDEIREWLERECADNGFEVPMDDSL